MTGIETESSHQLKGSRRPGWTDRHGSTTLVHQILFIRCSCC